MSWPFSYNEFGGIAAYEYIVSVLINNKAFSSIKVKDVVMNFTDMIGNKLLFLICASVLIHQDWCMTIEWQDKACRENTHCTLLIVFY